MLIQIILRFRSQMRGICLINGKNNQSFSEKSQFTLNRDNKAHTNLIKFAKFYTRI